MTITTTEYGGFQQAFDYFNHELFANKLRPCLITLQRKGRTRGYFSRNQFQSRIGDDHTDEIALNPANFDGRTDEEILSTLVHEMVHQYQHLYGRPGRGRYHNRQWADMMITRGLIPSSTGEPGGKQTGDRVSHYIQPGGRFQRTCQKLLDGGFKLNWQDEGQSRVEVIKGGCPIQGGPKMDRWKYTCPTCGLNAWAKPSALLLCGGCCMKYRTVHVMKPADWDADFVNWSDTDLDKLALVHGG